MRSGRPPPGAGKTNTFLGERYRRLARRRGREKALVAVGRSILVIVWHLLSDATACFVDLGPDYHDRHGYGPYVQGRDPEYARYTDLDKDGIVCE